MAFNDKIFQHPRDFERCGISLLYLFMSFFWCYLVIILHFSFCYRRMFMNSDELLSLRGVLKAPIAHSKNVYLSIFSSSTTMSYFRFLHFCITTNNLLPPSTLSSTFFLFSRTRKTIKEKSTQNTITTTFRFLTFSSFAQ